MANVEVFRHPDDYDLREHAEPGGTMEPGWYYWYCHPGCLPDSDPIGPFDTAKEAEEDATEEEER